MPKLWNETIAEHRHEVRAAIIDSTASLVDQHGLVSVTMSQVAEEARIGRATLYKYFSDIEAILFAWHQREISGHLEQLAAARDRATNAGERLEGVLSAYALISYGSRGHHDSELSAILHRDDQVIRAERKLRNMIQVLLSEAAREGVVRSDVAFDELASYCLHALAASRGMASKAAVRRLVSVTMEGLRARS